MDKEVRLYNKALQLAKYVNRPVIYGFTNGYTGKFVKIEPVVCYHANGLGGINADVKDLEHKYDFGEVDVVRVAYPDKNPVEEGYDQDMADQEAADAIVDQNFMDGDDYDSMAEVEDDEFFDAGFEDIGPTDEVDAPFPYAYKEDGVDNTQRNIRRKNRFPRE